MRRRRLAAALVLVLAVAGCATPSSQARPLPPAHGVFDYQIGGPYAPDPSVQIISRDRRAAPVAGKYNICYLNALQTQPDPVQPNGAEGTLTWWVRNHPDLVLKDSDGDPVIDDDWAEAVLDVSTSDKRRRLLEIEKPWIDGCRAAGFQAIEPDNLDSYDRSDGNFLFDADRDFAVSFVAYAHSRNLAVAQKNAGDDFGAAGRTEVGFDFAIAEECADYDECADYTAAYGDHYIDIEYDDQDGFRKACRDYGRAISVILRDRKVVPKGTAGYRYETCA
ncbi:endo alpha-1,4 polygalactosaminidase [Fodinicola acaciae]|uniref:endo alpha-1,4 polygalactosaminidase n=1 Tax=Fodinicola acaciae TaxID=2681555 RepID=UPI0013D72E73|nr:endo alpha-1,4 polygalactosaminidase [Fodinicola acaciae]